MNSVEILILKVIEEKQVQINGEELVYVTYEYDCYGNKGVESKYVYPQAWERTKKKGYYWG